MNDSSPSNPSSAPFQYIAVPNEHVAAVYRLLAERSESSGKASLEIPDTAHDSNSDLVWNEKMLARFARGENKTTQMVGTIMDLLAENPTEMLTLDELAERTGWPRSQVKTLWTHMTRHTKAHYGTDHWPLRALWGNELDPPRPQVVYYFLTADEAERWKRARKA
ncbi:MAG TPA: helix-turn-helix domain-containing protein [Galbitalea sp.]|nr:helix-turn-helix domain-containing protein [Galbitalea sp.]